MKTRLRICSVALLAAVVAGSISHTAWAQRSGRSVVAGRQQVRAALAVAMADGKLTAVEQYSILQKGKKLLSPVELQDLKQSLIQLTDPAGVLRPACHPKRTKSSRPTISELNRLPKPP